MELTLFQAYFKSIMRYIMFLFILFLIGCSMNTTSNNIDNKDKVSNVEFKINKKAGVQIND